MDMDVARSRTRPRVLAGCAPAIGIAAVLAVPAAAAPPRPSVAITAHPARISASDGGVFSWRRSAAQRTECDLGRPVVARCSPPFRTHGLADGWHTFTVRVFAGGRVRSTWSNCLVRYRMRFKASSRIRYRPAHG